MRVNPEPATNKALLSGSRKAREFARREREILRAALLCLGDQDPESVTVAKIAELVGIAKGTMYLHFSSKQEIYARLSLDFHHSLLANLNCHIDNVDNDRLSKMVELAFQFYLAKPNYRCVTQYCEREDFRRNLSPVLMAEFDAIDREFHQMIRSELERGIASGHYKSVATEQIIPGLKCTFHGALTQLWDNRNGEQDSAEHFIKNIVDYMVAPLLVDRGRRDRKLTDRITQTSHYQESVEFDHE